MAASHFRRDWVDLSWRRLVVAAVLAPLPTLYIGFAAFFLSQSGRDISRLLQLLSPEPQLFCWGFSVLFAILYLNIVSRLRGRVGLVECIAMGGIAAMMVALSFFAALELDIVGPLPYMTLFPGIVLSFHRDLLIGGAVLGAILAPAGALSGWIFWRIGIAPATPRSKTEVF
jgi:hypothetical protein